MYPSRTTQPSCIVLPTTNANNFEIKPGMINMLPKFDGSEDPYLFIREFEEVCSTLKLQQLTDDSIRLRLINFSLKDNAKKWLYALPANSITTWDQLVMIFLKFFPNHKTAKIRMNINQFIQKEGESLWRYLERFKDLLLQCPHHGFEVWRLVQILYEGLNYTTRTMVESMCSGEFTNKNETEAWAFLEEVAEKSMQWETIREPEKLMPSKGGIHSIDSSFESEAKFASLIRRVEALEMKPNHDSVNQVSTSNSTTTVCILCKSSNHLAETVLPCHPTRKVGPNMPIAYSGGKMTHMLKLIIWMEESSKSRGLKAHTREAHRDLLKLPCILDQTQDPFLLHFLRLGFKQKMRRSSPS
ncbi:hypothetical protein QJS04_geneDACA014972 [Acorus gramineus]|uniref:Retrotransposon gag domain-containing protein n=1 Tax=Acorus gramineus TaxID=55184 RepID=A0AAV9ANC4_ACOGR|nr:hypothetical protein QJS04_geneDACA014972 [Acorus gramineus]